MKMTKMTALLLAAAMALTACGSTAAVSSEAAASAAAPEVTASPEEAAVEPAAETAVTYPLTVTDQLGREVTIETEPKTLASGYYISTSLLIALGVQDELVGVEAKADQRTIYSLSAPELQSLPSIGTAKEFDLEGCAALTPDLVIVPAKLKDSIPQMEEQAITARQIEKLGLGCAFLDKNAITSESLKAAIVKLRTQPSYKATAAEFSADMKSLGGAKASAEALLHFLKH